MSNIDLPASTHLSPDAELSDARKMPGAPQTLMPKSLLEEFRFPLLEDLVFRSNGVCAPHKNLKLWLFSYVPCFLFKRIIFISS